MLLLPQVKDTVGRKQLEFQRGWRQGLGFSDPDYILTLEQQTVLFCWLVLLSRARPPPVRLLLQQDHCFCLLRVISLCTCISALCNPCFPLQCHGWPAQLLERWVIRLLYSLCSFALSSFVMMQSWESKAKSTFLTRQLAAWNFPVGWSAASKPRQQWKASALLTRICKEPNFGWCY